MNDEQIINSHQSLLARIEEVKAQKKIHEKQLQEIIREFADGLDHVKIIKRYLRELAEDKQIQTDVTKIAATVGKDFFIGKIFGKYRSMAGFLSSIIIENISSKYINKYAYKFIDNVRTLIATK